MNIFIDVCNEVELWGKDEEKKKDEEEEEEEEEEEAMGSRPT